MVKKEYRSWRFLYLVAFLISEIGILQFGFLTWEKVFPIFLKAFKNLNKEMRNDTHVRNYSENGLWPMPCVFCVYFSYTFYISYFVWVFAVGKWILYAWHAKKAVGIIVWFFSLFVAGIPLLLKPVKLWKNELCWWVSLQKYPLRSEWGLFEFEPRKQ